MKNPRGADPIHGCGEGEKKKDEEYKKSRTKINVFSSDKPNSNKHIMRYLDVQYIARDSWKDPWMGTPFIDLSTEPVQHVQEPPSVYFIPLSSPTSPLSMLLAHPTRGFFTLFVDFPPHPRVTRSTRMCRDPWMGIIDESRATDPVDRFRT